VGEDLEIVDAFLYYQEIMSLLTVGVGRGYISPRPSARRDWWSGNRRTPTTIPVRSAPWFSENGTSGRLPPLDPTIQLDNHTGASGVNRAGTVVGFSNTEAASPTR
jgi:hypothetical protein